MESLSDREHNRADIRRRTGVDIDAPFTERLRQQIPHTVMSALNALNAIRPGAATVARPVQTQTPVPAIRFQGQTFTGPNHVAAAETASQRLNVPIDTIFEQAYLGGGDGFVVGGRYVPRDAVSGRYSENITKGRITGGPNHPEGTQGLLDTQPIRPATNPLGDFVHGRDRGGPMPSNTRRAYDTPYMRIRSNNPYYEGAYRQDPFNRGTVSLSAANENLPTNRTFWDALVDQTRVRERPFDLIPGGRPPDTTKGGRPNNPPVRTEEILDWLRQADIPVRNIHRAPQTGTEYIRMVPPGGERPNTPISQIPSVRIPGDEHLGFPRTASEIPNLYDTGTLSPPNRPNYIPPTASNISGRPYSDPANLYDALRWRFSRSPDGQFLIAPDQAPRGVIVRPTPEPPARPDPNQMDLFNEYMMRVLKDGPR